MAAQGVGNTALGAGVCRLIEQYQPPAMRLFNDPVVGHLVGAPIEFLMRFGAMRNFTLKQTEAVLAGLYGAQVCRTRYSDEVVLAALAQGIKQVVILGAGLDTRAYRLPGIAQAQVFEVDLPTGQNAKKQKLQKHLGHLPANVTYLPIDFTQQTLESIFAGTGFERTQPTVFIWEGVTQYLAEGAVRQTLAFVGQAAPGSHLAFTYVLKSVIERRSNLAGADKMLERVAKNNAPWLFGLEPTDLRAYLQPLRLQLVADVGNADYQEKYLKPLQRQLAVTEVERVAQAVVA